MFRRFRTTLTVLIALAIASVLALRLKNKQDDPERGDVPGWVMITMMSAVLVAAILAIAQPGIRHGRCTASVADHGDSAGFFRPVCTNHVGGCCGGWGALRYDA